MRIRKLNQVIIFTVAFVFIALIFACKSKKTATSKTVETDATSDTKKTKGIVSHQFQSAGCQTIVICKKESDTLFLIPMTSLDKFDVDGLEISFDYRVLKVHNPKGCHGIPVQISNITSKKRLK
jgi:hypothetical protein